MAFKSPRSDRTDDLRFRSPQSPLDGSSTGFPSVTSPLRALSGTVPVSSHTSPPNGDARGGLTRRFTTNVVTTASAHAHAPLSPIGQQRRQAAEQTDLTTATYHKVQLPTSAFLDTVSLKLQLEKKRMEFEYLRETRKRFQVEMDLLELAARREETELNRMTQDLTLSSGRQSEPNTPPEYNGNSGFPTPLSRPNRFSATLMSPPGFAPGLAGASRRNSGQAQLSSPPTVSNASQGVSHAPSKSVPGSRRESDEEDGYDLVTKTPGKKTGATLHRNSMPASGFDFRSRGSGSTYGPSSGNINATSLLLEDESDGKTRKRSSDVSSYLQLNTTDNNFPILVRREGGGSMQLSASSAALDLATAQTPEPEQVAVQSPPSAAQSNGWGVSRHRAGLSLPMNSIQARNEDDPVIPTPTKVKNTSRRSMEVKFADSPVGDVKSTPPSASMPRLQSSYSTNDIPTMAGGNNSFSTPTNNHAEQHLHKHNASLGRIPRGAASNRHSREVIVGESNPEERSLNFSPHHTSTRSALQANAAPFAYTPALAPATSTAVVPANAVAPMSQQYNQQYYNGYGMPMVNMQGGMQGNNSFHNGPAWGNQMQQPVFSHPYGAYGMAYQPNPYQGRSQDMQPRANQRRLQNGEDNSSRFVNAEIESFRGQLYSLSKDQHGCRFLQKKLEEQDQSHIQMIFDETNRHVVELMTDPFGNYLCQKLLEFSNEAQRTTLINNAAPEMVSIALNQHGTRALQKMIEYISTPQQVATITRALKASVVHLIKDLNGNHVIQKCLNHLESDDAQFIIDAVGRDCVIVGTHRHGCCVIQRCIDHASPAQKPYLVAQITENAYQLVQDPFGNYVVQYILDLGEPSFTTPLCLGFRGSVAALSKQKFSSNVIEKVLRSCDPETKHLLIEELLHPQELERLLRDSFGNYVVQTAMDWAEPNLATRLVEAIRPLLPIIRSTPYGRRIANKIAERDSRVNGRRASGHSTGSLTASPYNQAMITMSPASSIGMGSGGRGVASPAHQAVVRYSSNGNMF